MTAKMRRPETKIYFEKQAEPYNVYLDSGLITWGIRLRLVVYAFFIDSYCNAIMLEWQDTKHALTQLEH